MRKVFAATTVLIAVLFLGLVSCVKEENPIPCETEQTLFMYMPWSSNLTSYFEQNLKDFETALESDILNNNRVIVFFASSPTEATLFELKYERGTVSRQTFKTYINPIFTTADGVTAILNDVVSVAPANKYAMIVSCHGMGWLPVTPASKLRGDEEKWHWEYEGVPLTRYFGGTSSQYQINITAFAEGISNAGLRMEYILFDDCYMSSVEVAYDLKDVTNHLIASPTEVLAYGFPYHLIAEHLINNNYRGICEGFYEFYKNSDNPYATIGMINCAEVESLASIMRQINQQYTFDFAKLGSLQRMDGYSPVLFFDLMHYIENLCPSDTELYQRFAEQFERTVPADCSLHTRSYYSMSMGVIAIGTYSGATISDPSINTRAATSKTETSWYRATH